MYQTMFMMAKHKKKSKKGKQELPNPSASEQVYKGPIVSKAMKKEEELYVVPLIFVGTLTSDGVVGKIAAYYSDNPGGYGLAEWTSLAGLYGEYRTLGLEVKYYPINRYSKTTTNCTPLVVYVDRSTPTTVDTSYQQAASNESARIVSLEDPWVEVAKMQNAEESQFIATAGPGTLKSVKFYADGLSVSTAYGKVFVYLLVQFRGRK